MDEREQRLIVKLRHELGTTINAALDDPDVIEVMVNPDGRIWLDTHDNGMFETSGVLSAVQIEMILGTVASALGSKINRDFPLLEGELPIGDCCRIEGLLPPIASGPCLTIRKPATKVYTLDDYVKGKIMEPQQQALLLSAIEHRKNVIICGGTGSGKTTLANAVIHAMAVAFPHERFVLIEDTLELQCSAPNTVRLHTTDAFDLDRLVRATMRLRPDRIIVGEVRGKEALGLLKAAATGHPGTVTTIHADDCVSALMRLEQLVLEAGVGPQPELIEQTIHLLMHIERTEQGRRITEMATTAELVTPMTKEGKRCLLN